jgi:hypothetical protein
LSACTSCKRYDRSSCEVINTNVWKNARLHHLSDLSCHTGNAPFECIVSGTRSLKV